jgi:hypothetical protein
MSNLPCQADVYGICRSHPPCTMNMQTLTAYAREESRLKAGVDGLLAQLERSKAECKRLENAVARLRAGFNAILNGGLPRTVAFATLFCEADWRGSPMGGEFSKDSV